ncbi:MAG: Holliday junction branch migration protein RuvA [Bacteroidetes bacterium HGW-Bacteroidetes-21]|jgi:Holliday junction DNA helicase RuvA|nr:MAG: Holliday junction branch migration protein RuvA [Bacteroidetes bacterium HGW-Bacteroidetes-21]
MYEYISGRVSLITPTYVILDNHGMGYQLHCSLNTFSKIVHGQEITLYTHFVVREDAQLLYGFIDRDEREMFRLLISVSGVGPNTARMILSSLSTPELTNTIINGNVSGLKQVKGIGLKTAERIIVDLRDKIGKATGEINIFAGSNNTKREEALSALIMLGFSKNTAEKALDKVLAGSSDEPIEVIIKQTLKLL